MRYTLTVPTPPPPPISASSSGSGWPWWAWALLVVAAMALAAASLLAPWNRWFGRVERWAFWRREWVRDRVRDHRGLVYLYAGLLAAVREVEEETGWRPGSLERLMSFQPMVSTLDSENVIFLAFGAEYLGKPKDINESERVGWIDLD